MTRRKNHAPVEASANMWDQVPRENPAPTVAVDAAVVVSERRGPLPGHGGEPRRAFTTREIKIISELARYGATRREVAAVLNMSVDTLNRRLRDTPAVRNAFFKGRVRTRLEIREKQIRIAMDDTHPKQGRMLIFLGKALLGQTPPPPVRTIVRTEADAIAVFTRLLPDVDVAALQRF